MTSERNFQVFNASGKVDLVRGEDELHQALSRKTEAQLRTEAAQPAQTHEEHLAVAFVRMEIERRAAAEAHERAKQLLDRSTLWTALATLVAAFGGAAVGAIITVWLD